MSRLVSPTTSKIVQIHLRPPSPDRPGSLDGGRFRLCGGLSIFERGFLRYPSSVIRPPPRVLSGHWVQAIERFDRVK